MSPKKIERLIRTLREQGVEYIKTPDIEIRLSLSHALPMVAHSDLDLARGAPMRPEALAKPADGPAPSTGAAIPPVETSIPHHENEVVKLLRLSDEDLVDRLFPDYSQAGNG